MYSWRISKYNPSLRKSDGSYLFKDEWTSFSDVGKSVELDEYLKTEEKYLLAIKLFLEEMNIKYLELTSLEQTKDYPVEEKVGEFVLFEQILSLSKRALREEIWCEFTLGHDFFIHFGYDFIIYIGANSRCENTTKHILDSGLFIESFVSPYYA